MDELNFIGVKAIAYCPETNAAEQLFKVIKKEYKFELLQFLAVHPARELDLLQLVKNLMTGEIKLDFHKVVR